MNTILFLLLPIAASFGWYMGFKHYVSRDSEPSNRSKIPPVNRDYFQGLNFLLNDQPDKAVDFFIQMLEVNDDTIETHLSLGTLFRRRGEVDRAIRVHQNVIARPHLAKEHRVQALSELGMDYLRAGFLDRAEKLFLELLAMKEETASSCNYLLNIYQLQKEWGEAIKMAEKLRAFGEDEDLLHKIAQYHCELADVEIVAKNYKSATEHLKKALRFDKNCVRANLGLGKIAEDEEKFKNAINFYLEVEKQSPDYLSEVVEPLKRCYVALDKTRDVINLLHEYLDKKPHTLVVLTLTDLLVETEGKDKALEFLLKVLERYPFLEGINLLLDFYIKADDTEDSGSCPKGFNVVKKVVHQLLTKKASYRCGHCGFSSKVLYWQCPGCKVWEGMKFS